MDLKVIPGLVCVGFCIPVDQIFLEVACALNSCEAKFQKLSQIIQNTGVLG